jgi:ABC-2 type transport system permease protein
MAGIAPFPEPLTGNTGPFSQVARTQYSALARMRWSMLANNARSVQGAFELGARSVTFLFYTMMGLGLGAGLGIGAYIMASRAKWQPLPILFWVVFVVWQGLPIALASFQEQFEFTGLLRFPLNFKSFYLLHLVFGLIDIPALLGTICSLGIAIGLTIARPDCFLWTALVLGVFAILNVFTARAILAWADRWLAQRKTREIVSALFLVLMLSLQFLNPALHEQRPHTQRKPHAHAGSPTTPAQSQPWIRAANYVVHWLPPVLAAESMREAMEHRPGQASESLALIGLYILSAGGALWIRLKAEFNGENLGEAPTRRRASRSDRKWVIDGSGPIAAVIEKELRTVPRSMPLLFALGAPLLTVLVIGTLLSNNAPAGGSPIRLAFPLCVSYTLLGFTNMIYNNLGTEGTGIQIFFLSPTPIRTVLLAKNLFHGLLYMLVAVLAAIFAIWRLGPPGALMLITTAAWLLFALPANLTVGNVLSLTMPYRLNLGRLSRQRGSQASALLSMLVQLAVVAGGAAVFELCAYLQRPWFAPAILLLLAVVMFFVWIAVLRKADAMADRNREALINALAKAE